jgi:DNA-binding transcriptional LysR family regulator
LAIAGQEEMRNIAKQICVFAKGRLMLDPRDLDDLVAVARTGSLSSAAKKRGVAVSTISRRIDALEANLKLQLVDRLAQGARLTRAGTEIAAAAEPLSAQLDRVARVAEALQSEAVELPMRLTATEFVISDVLAPRLDRLWATGASFPLHLQSEAGIVSLAGREADIAIRMTRPEGASLIIQKLPALELGLFATADVAAKGTTAKLLVYDDSYGRLPELDWIEKIGLRASVAMRTGSTRALLTAARSGSGVALLPEAIALRYPDLVRVELESKPLPRIPWLVVHRDLQRLPAIRKIHRWVRDCFAQLVAGERV